MSQFYHIEVECKSKGDFGYIIVGNVQYDKTEEHKMYEQIKADILRHVDRVANVWIIEHKEVPAEEVSL